MSLFGFGNIQFNVGQNSTRGPLQSLTENKYKTTTLRYPIDIGNVDKGHYMVIYIKKQAESQADENLTPTSFVEATNSALKNPLGDFVNTARDTVKGNFGGQLSTGIQNTFNQLNNATGGTIGNLSSSVGNAFKTITGNLGNINNPFGQANIINANGAVSQEINRSNIKSLVSGGDLVRNIKKTTRTNQVIALYMPDTLQFDYTQDYETLSLGATAAGIAGAAAAGTIGQD